MVFVSKSLNCSLNRFVQNIDSGMKVDCCKLFGDITAVASFGSIFVSGAKIVNL